MKYWRTGNDLYTGDVSPVENAEEISKEEYQAIFDSRVITHLPELEMEGVEEDAEDSN